jgi:hypothetical protein
MTTLRDHVTIYLHNRAEFYRTLLPRIPHPALRREFELFVALQPLEPELPWPDDAAGLREMPEDLLSAFTLRDLIKRPANGRSLGRTAISFEEAISRAQDVEETGLLFFELLGRHLPDLAGLFQTEAEKHRATLADLIRFDDEVRYHRGRGALAPAEP